MFKKHLILTSLVVSAMLASLVFAQDGSDKFFDEDIPKQPGMSGQQGERHLQKTAQGEGRHIPKLTAEDEENVLAHLKEFSPAEYNDIITLREQGNTAEFKRAIFAHFREIKAQERLRESNPEEYQFVMKMKHINKKVFDQIKLIREEKVKEIREEKKKELKVALAELFELREQKKVERIKKLEEELTKLKEIVKKRQDNKNAIIEDYMKEILGEKDDLRW